MECSWRIYTTVEIEKFNNKTKENNANEPDLQTKIEYLGTIKGTG